MVTITTEIRGQETSVEYNPSRHGAGVFAYIIGREDPFQRLGSPNLASAGELIDPTLELNLDGPYNRNDHMVQYETARYSF